MIEMIETIPTRVATKTGSELDAIEHAGDLIWHHGERAKIKTGMRRRHRREVRRTLRMAY